VTEVLILREVGHQRMRVLELRIVQRAPDEVADTGIPRTAEELIRGRGKVENVTQTASTPWPLASPPKEVSTASVLGMSRRPEPSVYSKRRT
jgi:hypothetical protein